MTNEPRRKARKRANVDPPPGLSDRVADEGRRLRFAGDVSGLSIDELLERIPESLPPSYVAAMMEEARRMVDLSRDERLKKAESNLFYFARYYFPNLFNNQTPAFHWELADMAAQCERPDKTGINRMVVAAPRGHAKSSLLTFLLPLYWICFKRKRFIVIISDTAKQAITFTMEIKRQLEENDRLRADFGDLIGDTVSPRPMKWTEEYLICAHKNKAGRATFTTTVFARSTDSKVRGIKSFGYRPDAVICDDLENDKNVRTKEQRQKAFEWFTQAVVPALDPATGTLLVIGTILHFDSLLNNLLKQAKEEDDLLDQIEREGWEGDEGDRPIKTTVWKLYRAIQDDGSILWPDRFSRRKLEQIKRGMLTLAFNCEFLNIPINEENRIYRPEWINWYTANELVFDDRRRMWTFQGEEMDTYVGVDPAISESDSADYFAYVVLGVTRQTKKIVVMYAQQFKIDFPTQVQEIMRLEATWSPRLIGIEKNAYQRALPQQLIKESSGIRIKQLDNGQARKYVRIVASAIFFENSQIWMRRAMPNERGTRDELGEGRVHYWMTDLYEQMMQYPASAHDDLLDAMENALQLAGVRSSLFQNWF